jgi:hypothetical protein
MSGRPGGFFRAAGRPWRTVHCEALTCRRIIDVVAPLASNGQLPPQLAGRAAIAHIRRGDGSPRMSHWTGCQVEGGRQQAPGLSWLCVCVMSGNGETLSAQRLRWPADRNRYCLAFETVVRRILLLLFCRRLAAALLARSRLPASPPRLYPGLSIYQKQQMARGKLRYMQLGAP